MKDFYNDLIDFLKKYFIGIIILASLALMATIITICYYNIPRLHYVYSKEYNGYIVDYAFGNSKSYTIPESYKDSKVVGIGSRAFYKHSNLETIEFENSDNIEIIMKLSFSECKKLKTIDIENVETIERNAFSYCESLNFLTISAYQIGGSAFYGCSSLDTITLNEGIKSIGSMAFSKTPISDIILPESVTHVYNEAFVEMPNLKSVTIKNKKLLENDYINSLGDLVKYVG